MTHLDLPALLERLESAGVAVSLHLRVTGRQSVLTPELQADLAAHRPLLLHRLAGAALWAELSRWRWGPARDDPEPGIVCAGPPDPTDLAERLAVAGAILDPYAAAEREAIQAEADHDQTD